MVGLTTATEAGLWPEVLTRAGGESEVVEAMRPSKRPLEASSIFVSRFNWEKSMGSAIKHGLLKLVSKVLTNYSKENSNVYTILFLCNHDFCTQI